MKGQKFILQGCTPLRQALFAVTFWCGTLSVSHFACAAEDTESNGTTALMQAAYNADIPRMKQLVDGGAPIDQPNNVGLTALFFAAGGSRTRPTPHGNIEAVKFLLAHGASVDVRSRVTGITPLMAAADNEHPDIVELLLKSGANINAVGSEGTALSMAVARLDVRTTQVLLNHGAKLDGYTDARGQTPLLTVIDASPSPNVSPSDIKTMSEKQKTAPGMAMLIAHLLIDHGADLNVRDHNGRSPLTLSIARQNILLARTLVEAGAEPNVTDRSMADASPLILAVRNRQSEIAIALLKKGANVDQKDRFGKTALDYANTYGPRGMVDILTQAAAHGSN